MENFQELLTEAAQLKEHQLKQNRKKFQNLPQFLKAGLSYQKKYARLRKQNYLFQFHVSQKLKSEGNEAFQNKKFDKSQEKYEEALSIFRYIESISFENMKDEDLVYHQFDESSLDSPLKNAHEKHLIALYLNISSCLTKKNKKEEAIFSAEEALKIEDTAKGHYKRAIAYLQYINRSADDVKIGIEELNKAYEMSKDPSILSYIVKVKDEIRTEKSKEKEWFKFMFQKNSQKSQQIEEKTEQKCEQKQQIKNQKRKQELSQIREFIEKNEKQIKFQKTKQRLEKFISMDDSSWLKAYRKEYISKNGSKIYSLLKAQNYQNDIQTYKLLLAKCLQNKKEEEQKNYQEQFVNWLKLHPVESIRKYLERYDQQVQWILKQKEQLKSKKKQEKPQEKINNHQPQLSEPVNETTLTKPWITFIAVLVIGFLIRLLVHL